METDRWLVLSVPAPARGEELMLVDALRRLGARAVEREGERFAAILPGPDPGAVPAVVRKAVAAVRASTSLTDPTICWRWEPHEAWARRWRAEQAPRRVSDRLVVAPTPPEGEGPRSGRAPPSGAAGGVGSPGRGEAAGDLVLRLDPTAAFGTAEHPTTRACLRILERRVRAGDRILDVGAGSGILAVAAALLGARRVLAVEADPVACEAARTNARLNRTAGRVEVRELEVGPGDLRRYGRFDGVVANLQADVVVPLLPDLARAVRRRGWIAVSGILRAERDALVAAAGRAGLALDAEEREAGWWTGVLRR